MPNVKATAKAPHVTNGDVLDDLALDPRVVLEAKIKADLWRELVTHIEGLQLRQKELAVRLEVHQPDVSNLLNGRISKFSVGTLIQYAVRLDLGVTVTLSSPKEKVRRTRALTIEASTVKPQAKARRIAA